jgi:hypothetical protein
MLSPQSTEAEFQDTLASVLREVEQLDGAVAVNTGCFLLFSSRLVEPQRSELLRKVISAVEASEEFEGEAKAAILLCLSILPGLPHSKALSYFNRAITSLESLPEDDKAPWPLFKALSYGMASLSPLITADKAEHYAEMAFATITTHERARSFGSGLPNFFLGTLQHSLPALKLRSLFIAILAGMIHDTRADCLLSMTSILGGESMQILDIHSMSRHRAPSQSLLERFGGPDAAVELYAAIRDNMRWWP